MLDHLPIGHGKKVLWEFITEDCIPAVIHTRRCSDSNYLYHAKVEEEGKSDASYVGLTDNTVKVRYGNHKTSTAVLYFLC